MPIAVFDFLTSKGKTFQALSSDFDPIQDGISKAANYCNQKACYIVAVSKMLILIWCNKNVPTCARFPLDVLISRYCDHRSIKSLILPIPNKWLEVVRNSDSSLFPLEYSHDFFSSLPGVGLKMRHLCSETIYDTVIGPAIDCHCIHV